jgi:putative membrane protein
VRLDPRSIPYRVVENGSRLAFFIAIGILTSSGGSDVIAPVFIIGFVVLGLVASAAWEVARYQRYVYDLTPDTFDIRSGVFSRREREIPYERVQNVDIAQNVVQRIVGIAEVRLETAGGSSTEASLRFVSRSEADRLQEEVSRRKRSAEPGDEESEETELFALEPRELAILGVVSADLRLVGLLSIVLSAFAPRLATELRPQYDLVTLVGPAIALVGILLFWVASAVLTVFRYYDFRLTRRGEELRYERGLLQRYSGTIPLTKVQTVTIRENVLARQLGYASLVVQTAGYAPGQDGASVESAVPIAKRDRLLDLARSVEPFEEVSFTRPPKRARTRYAVRYSLALVALVGGLWIVDSITGLLPLWYLPLAGLLAVPIAAHLAWKHRGYDRDDEYVITRNGFWRRRTMVVPYDRVQTVASSQTVFQRRRHLGTVTVDTAGTGGLGGGDAVAVDIDADVAERLREEVGDRFHRAIQRESAQAPG